jgi:hypothetical protein
MHYSSFYKLMHISVCDSKTDLPFKDVFFKPTIVCAKLLAKLGLNAVCNEDGISIYYKEKYDSVPQKKEVKNISFNKEVLDFSFATHNIEMLNRLYESVPSNPIDTKKWLYKINDDQSINKKYLFPAVFTNYISALPNKTVQFSIKKNGNTILKYDKLEVSGDSDGKYACTADLTAREAGEYELFVQDVETLPAYIDTHNELDGKTGLLQMILKEYNYTSYSSSSPPEQQIIQTTEIVYKI